MNRFWYVTCWVFEVLAILGLILALTVPVQDYLREYIEWHQHPTPEAYQAFLERQRQERSVRFLIAMPFGIVAVWLSGPLRKYRRVER